jgi:Tfp pilus assembly protein PilE
MEILKHFVFLYAVLTVYKSYKNYHLKFSRNFSDAQLQKMKTFYKHSNRARDSILERKRTPRSHVLPEEK